MLRRGGWLVLVGNGCSTTGTEPIVHEYNQILRANANDRAVNFDRYDLSGPASRAFASGGMHHAMFCDVVKFTWEEFLGNALSLSTTPLPGQPDFIAFHEQLKMFFEQHKSGNTIGLPMHCEMYVGRLH